MGGAWGTASGAPGPPVAGRGSTPLKGTHSQESYPPCTTQHPTGAPGQQRASWGCAAGAGAWAWGWDPGVCRRQGACMGTLSTWAPRLARPWALQALMMGMGTDPGSQGRGPRRPGGGLGMPGGMGCRRGEEEERGKLVVSKGRGMVDDGGWDV